MNTPQREVKVERRQLLPVSLKHTLKRHKVLEASLGFMKPHPNPDPIKGPLAHMPQQAHITYVELCGAERRSAHGTRVRAQLQTMSDNTDASQRDVESLLPPATSPSATVGGTGELAAQRRELYSASP